jgi:multisubunit Na+/H+ antiporter MnhF subunit
MSLHFLKEFQVRSPHLQAQIVKLDLSTTELCLLYFNFAVVSSSKKFSFVEDDLIDVVLMFVGVIGLASYVKRHILNSEKDFHSYVD